MTTGRRSFILGASAIVGSLAAPRVARAAKPRVVIIGGGPGGATLAKYISKEGAEGFDVTIIEPNKIYFTCFTSNWALGDLKSFDTLEYGYAPQVARGVHVIADSVTMVDRARKTIRLAGGATLDYDRLVMAPGIDFRFDAIPGYSETASETMPHAWRGEAQMRLLKARLDAVPDGGTIVIIAPPEPYRCPPAPYERASMMAERLKATGRGKARIIILDAKESFSKQPLFAEGWDRHHTGMVEWQAPSMHGGVQSVDVATNSVTTGLETITADLVNVIPPQTAGSIAIETGLTDATGFCPVNGLDFRSLTDREVHVIGDAAIAGDMPKSAFAANNQAKTIAMELRHEFFGSRLLPVRYTSTCWSALAQDDVVKNGGRYEPKDGRVVALETFVSALDEPPALRKRQFEEAIGWYRAMTTDIFG
jgi:NADPH-dependent 2,4-dienoyl-CoA reductase/sulfur reductase-like enzyme